MRFVIHSIMMTVAAMAELIMDNREMLMNEFLSTNHVSHIIAGNVQMRFEVVTAPKDAKEGLKTTEGATLLYGSELKKKIEEELKYSKLIINQESTGTTTTRKSEATQQSQQQVQAIQPTHQQQMFTGLRSNGNDKGWNNKFFEQPATFAN
ncbi:MAG: hypothetical protein EZS28_053674 [Streblomastix strix]|uniref:Uncharacterized protein n=1 Tax=Streblomastix strix TaxID=222440 RepID=A0A5J4R6Y6_9EUKA|nr:MAG: hypothetical protein EZS28_053674 [Streblomastix strix]